METFDPPAELAAEYKKRGLDFTIGKQYLIHSEILEENRQAGVRYITTDDNGNRRSVNSLHFNTPGKLVWNDVVEDEAYKKMYVPHSLHHPVSYSTSTTYNIPSCITTNSTIPSTITFEGI